MKKIDEKSNVEENLNDIKFLVGWRNEIFGKYVLKMISGEIKFFVKNLGKTFEVDFL